MAVDQAKDDCKSRTLTVPIKTIAHSYIDGFTEYSIASVTVGYYLRVATADIQDNWIATSLHNRNWLIIRNL